MKIHLIPLGPDGYELYCEVDDHPSRSDDPSRPDDAARRPQRRRASESSRPWMRRATEAFHSWAHRATEAFHRSLAYIEAERRRRLALAAAAEPRTRMQRLRDRVLGWLAERIAEQRLLWHLRSQVAATADYPDDLTEPQARAIVVGSLRRDGRRHLRWACVHTVLYLASLPLTPIPGPNIFALVFSFRAIGHALSWLGARQGVRRVVWSYAPCAVLTELRALPRLSGAERDALARDVARRLDLRHLDTFVERLALAGPWYTRRA